MGLLHKRLLELLFLVLTLYQAITTFGCAQYTTQIGNIVPMDPLICVSQNVTFTCTLHDQLSDPEDIVFEKNGNIVPTDDIRKINSTVAQYTMYNISLADDNLQVVCCAGKCNREDGSNMTPSTTMLVFSMPQKVVDMSCEVYNYDGNMTCTWNYGMEYFMSKDRSPTTTCRYRVRGYSWEDCPVFSIEGNELRAVWSGNDGFFRRTLLEFNITIQSECGVVVSSTFEQDTRIIVRPAPVYSINTEVINSTCILIKWKTRKTEHNKTHRVTVSGQWQNVEVPLFNASEEDYRSFVGKMVCDLHPYTDYTFGVQIIPTEGGMWSPVTSVTGKTKASAPSRDPDLVEGGYRWDPKQCAKPGDNRDVCIYWKSLSEEFHNGEIKGYHLELIPKSGEMINIEQPRDSTFKCVRRLSCDVDYDVRIIARGSVGNSPNKTSIKIIKAVSDETSLRPPSFIPEIVHSSEVNNEMQHVQLTWPDVTSDMMTKLGVDGFTACWCVKERGDCKKTVPFDCTHVSGHKHGTTINISNPEEYLYGVSITTVNGYSGLQWQSCIYLKHAEPTREPQMVSAVAGSEDNTISLTWNKLACESGQPYTPSYTIQYCPVNRQGQDCSGDVKEHIVPSNVSRHVIRGLVKDQLYMVQVRGLTNDGKASRWSNPAYAKAKINDKDTELIIGLSTAGSLVLIALIGVGLWYLRKRVCKHIKSQQAIKMPELNIGIAETTDEPFDDKGYEYLDRAVRFLRLDSGVGDEMTVPNDDYIVAVPGEAPTFKDKNEPAPCNDVSVVEASVEPFSPTTALRKLLKLHTTINDAVNLPQIQGHLVFNDGDATGPNNEDFQKTNSRIQNGYCKVATAKVGWPKPGLAKETVHSVDGVEMSKETSKLVQFEVSITAIPKPAESESDSDNTSIVSASENNILTLSNYQPEPALTSDVYCDADTAAKVPLITTNLKFPGDQDSPACPFDQDSHVCLFDQDTLEADSELTGFGQTGTNQLMCTLPAIHAKNVDYVKMAAANTQLTSIGYTETKEYVPLPSIDNRSINGVNNETSLHNDHTLTGVSEHLSGSCSRTVISINVTDADRPCNAATTINASGDDNENENHNADTLGYVSEDHLQSINVGGNIITSTPASGIAKQQSW